MLVRCVVFASLLARIAFAEPHALGTALLLAPLAPSVGGPSQRIAGSVHPYVVMFEYEKRDGSFTKCSGTVIEGCVVTAGHCFDDYRPGQSITVFNGDEAKTGLSLVNYGRAPAVLGGVGPADLAVFRLDVPARNFLGRVAIPKQNELQFPRRGMIVGYGATGSEEMPDGSVRLTGAGEKREGMVLLQGLGRVTTETTVFDGSTGKDVGRRQLVASRGPSITAPGDSGGPMFSQDGKLYGVGGSSVSIPLVPNKAQTVPRPEEIVYSQFTYLPDHAEALEKKMDELDCATNVYDRVLNNTFHRLKVLAESENGRAAGNAWLDAAAPAEKTAIVAALRGLLGYGKDTPVTVLRTTRQGNTLTADVEAKNAAGRGVGALTVTIDLATGNLRWAPTAKN